MQLPHHRNTLPRYNRSLLAAAVDVMRRIPQRHVPHHVGKVIDARVPLPNVTLLSADAVLPSGVDGVLEAHDLQRAVARQHGHDVVEGNVFAVELFVNQVSNVGHQRVVR